MRGGLSEAAPIVTQKPKGLRGIGVCETLSAGEGARNEHKNRDYWRIGHLRH